MKKTITSLFLVTMAIAANAQGRILGNAPTDLEAEAKTWFPIIISVSFIVGSLGLYAKYLAGKEKDIKAFIVGIVILAVSVGIITAAYSYIKSVNTLA